MLRRVHSSTDNARVADTLAEVVVPGVVGKAAELILHGLGQRGGVDMRVLGLLARELRVEVRRVQNGLLYNVRTQSVIG